MWVITSAIQACREFQKVIPDFTVSINISPSNLREADLPYYVDRALRTWNVKGESIVIEITETAMMVEQATSHEALRQLKALGVKLSVDDFGTGYSSMQYLAQLPLDELKIDLSFVKGMLDQPQNAKIVRSLIDLAHNLELKVVAEGVESSAILAALDQLGCDHAQGWDVGSRHPPRTSFSGCARSSPDRRRAPAISAAPATCLKLSASTLSVRETGVPREQTPVTRGSLRKARRHRSFGPSNRAACCAPSRVSSVARSCHAARSPSPMRSSRARHGGAEQGRGSLRRAVRRRTFGQEGGPAERVSPRPLHVLQPAPWPDGARV